MDASALGLAAAGAALGLSAAGSALGTGYAGMAAVGAWKKCFAQDKPAPFILIAFVGAPLTQTIYGFILMNQIFGASAFGSQCVPVVLRAPAVHGRVRWTRYRRFRCDAGKGRRSRFGRTCRDRKRFRELHHGPRYHRDGGAISPWSS